jgi:hypothetical protein
MSKDLAKGKKKGPMFLASRSRANIYRDILIAGTLVIGGILVVIACLYLIMDSGPSGIYLFMGGFGIAVAVIGVDMGIHIGPRMAREYIMVDMKSARLLEDGHLIKELVFEDKVMVGAAFNYGINVPELSPLYGIEFDRAGEKIVVSPAEGYALHYVKKLWPMTMTIIRKHELGITQEFRKNLEYEKDKGGYWAEIHEELLGKKKTKVLKEIKPENPSKVELK